MSFFPGRFYRYRKLYGGVTKSNLKIGDIYQFQKQTDLFPKLEMSFVLQNAFGEDFGLECSYESLDRFRIEDAFEEIPKPSWWGERREAAGD